MKIERSAEAVSFADIPSMRESWVSESDSPYSGKPHRVVVTRDGDRAVNVYDIPTSHPREASVVRMTVEEAAAFARVILGMESDGGEVSEPRVIVVRRTTRPGVTTCDGCPLFDNEWAHCQVERERGHVFATEGERIPEWCPLRAGDVVVRLEREVTE